MVDVGVLLCRPVPSGVEGCRGAECRMNAGDDGKEGGKGRETKEK